MQQLSKLAQEIGVGELRFEIIEEHDLTELEAHSVAELKQLHDVEIVRAREYWKTHRGDEGYRPLYTPLSDLSAAFSINGELVAVFKPYTEDGPLCRQNVVRLYGGA